MQRHSPPLHLDVLSPDDAAQTALLAKNLDHLAFALEQAGAYIAARRITFAQYRARWAERFAEINAWCANQPQRAGEHGYPKSVDGSPRSPSTWSLPHMTRVTAQGVMDRLSVSIIRQVDPLEALDDGAGGVRGKVVRQDPEVAMKGDPRRLDGGPGRLPRGQRAQAGGE